MTLFDPRIAEEFPDAVPTTAQIEARLDAIHFDGEGCGTYGTNGCSNCHGPSPMSAHEVAADLSAHLAAVSAPPSAATHTVLTVERLAELRGRAELVRRTAPLNPVLVDYESLLALLDAVGRVADTQEQP